MEITGTIKILGNSEKVSDKLTKLQVVVTTDEQYPQDISIDFLNDKVDLLKNFKVGNKVIIGINLRGREYNGKYYNNIVGWRISQDVSEVTNSQQQPAREVEADLPF
jgi:translation initiation factor IF-3